MRKLTILCILIASVTSGDCGEADKGLDLGSALDAMPDRIKTPDRWALLIGISDYRDERIPDLPACDNDVAALRRILTDPRGGLFPEDHVTALVGEAVDRVEVVDTLDRLARKVGPEDLVFVFFTGHGTVDERGRAYWVLPGTDPDRLRATALPESEVTSLLGDIRTSRLVTVIDACYSAATAEVGRTKSTLDLQKIHPRFDGEGRVAITGSKGDQISLVIDDETHPGHGFSAFAWHLIQALRGRADENADGVVTLDETWRYVKDRTEATSRAQGGDQRPQLKGQIGSKFLLTLNPAALGKAAERYRAAEEERRRHLARLEELALAEEVSAAHFRLGKRLLSAFPEDLALADRQRRRVFVEVCEGGRAAAKLPRMLELLAQRESGPADSGRRAAGTSDGLPTDPAQLEDTYGTRSREAVELMLASAKASAGGDPASGLAMAEKALVLDGEFQLAHYHRANALIGLGEIDAAADVMELSIALKPDSRVAQAARSDMAITWARVSRNDAADRWFSRAILADPDDRFGMLARIYRNWALNQARRGMSFSAMHLARIASRHDPDSEELAELVQVLGERAIEDDHVVSLVTETPESEPPPEREMTTTLEELESDIRIPPNAKSYSMATLDGRHVIVASPGDTAYRVVSVDGTSPRVDEIDMRGKITALRIFGDRLYVALADPDVLLRCVPTTGEIERRWILPAPTTGIAVLAATDELFCCIEERLYRLSLRDRDARPVPTQLLADRIVAHPTDPWLFSLRFYQYTEEDNAKLAEHERRMEDYYHQVEEYNQHVTGFGHQRDVFGRPRGGRSRPAVPIRPMISLQATLTRILVTEEAVFAAETRYKAAINPSQILLGHHGRLVGTAGGGGFRPSRTQKELGWGYGLALFDSWEFSQPVIFHDTDAYPRQATINPASGQVAVTCAHGGLFVFDPLIKEPAFVTEPILLEPEGAEEGEEKPEPKPDNSFSFVSWAGDGRHLVAGMENGIVRIWRNRLTPKESERGRTWSRDLVIDGERRIAGVGRRSAPAEAGEPGKGGKDPVERQAVHALREFAPPGNAEALARLVAGFGTSVRLAGSPPRWQDREAYAEHPAFHLADKLEDPDPESDRLGISIYRLRSALTKEGSPPVELALARCYLLQERIDAARPLLLSALNGDAGLTDISTAALAHLRDCYLQQDRNLAAVACLVWSAHLDGRDHDLASRAARALEELGCDEAAEAFRR